MLSSNLYAFDSPNGVCVCMCVCVNVREEVGIVRFLFGIFALKATVFIS